ncbi:MAG: dTDP-glucose 4,6-dehydratase [Planctomycetota bacterium]|nr:MAG: dTDP-glucose 4,6-dehydratase [Planctomycetota bacterium]
MPPGCVLITGGAGFIGSTLVRQWLEHEPESIVNLDALTYAGLRESLGGVLGDPRHVLVAGDVADAALVGRVLAELRPRAILHLAAETHVDRSIDSPPQFARTNVLGTCTLLDQATRYWQRLAGSEREAFRLLLVSTDEVFGAAEAEARFTEHSPLAPNSPYAASKAAGEHFARAFGHTYGLPVITLNPTNNYGPRQSPEKLIPRLIVSAMRGQSLPIYGDGLQQRDWLHVEDCCAAIRTVLRCGTPGRRYLAGADNDLPNLRVAELVCDLVDELLGGGPRRRFIRHVADRPGHDRRYAVDSGPLRQLGWRPAISLENGLRSAVQWYAAHPGWVERAEAALQVAGGGSAAAAHRPA